MKSRKQNCFTAIALLAALAIPVRLAAQQQMSHFRHYKLIDIGTFGGPQSSLNETIPFVNGNGDLNSRGIVVGSAATSIPTTGTSNFLVCGGISGAVPFVYHAFEWQKGVVTDLGAFPGADNCSVANGSNANGEIVGNSENGEIDPLTGVNQTRPVLWQDGQIINLGTFGGNQGVANSINNRGQIVGASLNRTPDPFSIFGLLLGSSNGTQTRAFLWKDGLRRDLGTLGGPDAAAILVNEHGQVAGVSYTNSTPNPATGTPTLDPFLWENGKLRDLGTLGGTTGFPLALNNRGQVVGESNIAGDLTAHPFLWPGANGRMQDLGTLGGSFGTANSINETGDVVGFSSIAGEQAEFFAFFWRRGVLTNLGSLNGDPCSTANGINSTGQVVGISFSTCDSSAARRAFLWEHGSMVDLNALIPPESAMQLTLAETINDRGEIAVNGTPAGCEVVEACGHAVLLIPVCEDDNEGCADAPLEPALIAKSQSTAGISQKAMTAEELATFKQELARIAGRNRGFGVWPRR